MTDEEKAKEWVRTNSGYSTKEFHGQKAQDTPVYAKELCDKLEHSMCDLAGSNYILRYNKEIFYLKN